MPRERAAAPIRDRHGDHHRHTPALFLKILIDGEQRRLAIQGVKDRFGQQQVHPAIDQSADLLGIGGDQLIVGDGPESRIVHVRRHGSGAVRRAHRAGDETRTRRVLRRRRFNGPASDPGPGHVQVVHQVFQFVVRHRDRGRVERVRLDDIRPGLQVLTMNALDNVRLRDGQ